MEQVSLMMAGAQLGITVCSLGLGAVGEPAVAHLLEGPFAAAGLPDALVHPVAFAIALVVVVSLHMVLGEMVPKNIALAGPERSAVVLGPLLYGVATVLRPLIWLLNRGANAVLRLLRVDPKEEVSSTFTQEEFEGLVDESRREGLLDQDEHALLTGALEFADRTASAVTIPAGEVVTAPRGATVAELEALCACTGYSRFPIAVDGGDLEGYVHLKDLLDVSGDARHQPVEQGRVRPLASVAEGDSLREVLATMQRASAHLARVVDRGSGRLVGVAALEDVLEELVGEVRDAAQHAGRRRAAPAGG
jgi:CBS domain containing-hemolysin-like protein